MKKATKPCRNWVQTGSCSFGDKCHFVHSGYSGNKLKSQTWKLTGGGGASCKALAPKGHGAYGRTRFTASDGKGNAERLTVDEVNAQLVFQAVVDTSGSMAGARTEQSIAGLRHIVSHAMRSTDAFGLLTFDSKVKKCHYVMNVGRVDFATDEAHIRANGGGCTALYDAMKAGREWLKFYKNKHTDAVIVNELLVITDGADNASTTTLEKIAAIMAQPGLPNFNMCVIAVGISDSTEADIRKITDGPAHCHFWRVENAAGLADRLQDVADRIKMVLEKISSNGTVQKITWKGERKKAGKALRQLAAQAPLMVNALESAPGLCDRMKALGF